MADLAGLVRSRVARLLALRVQDLPARITVGARLRRIRPVVLGECFRLAAAELAGGRGGDKAGQRALARSCARFAMTAPIRDDSWSAASKWT